MNYVINELMLSVEENERKQLDLALNNADGTVTVKVKGKETEVHGDGDKLALLIAAHALIIVVAQNGARSFEDAMKLVSNLHDCLNTEIEGEFAE